MGVSASGDRGGQTNQISDSAEVFRCIVFVDLQAAQHPVKRPGLPSVHSGKSKIVVRWTDRDENGRKAEVSDST
jgi:hypothetical protein